MAQTPMPESDSNAGDCGSIPGLGRSPGEGNSYPPQYSCLGNCRECEDCLERSQEMNFYQEYIHGIKIILTTCCCLMDREGQFIRFLEILCLHPVSKNNGN